MVLTVLRIFSLCVLWINTNKYDPPNNQHRWYHIDDDLPFVNFAEASTTHFLFLFGFFFTFNSCIFSFSYQIVCRFPFFVTQGLSLGQQEGLVWGKTIVVETLTILRLGKVALVLLRVLLCLVSLIFIHCKKSLLLPQELSRVYSSIAHSKRVLLLNLISGQRLLLRYTKKLD